MLSWAENLTWYEETRQKGFDEVLLLNEGGEVCECTSANVFAAKSGPAETEVWTPPLSSGCLPGVTRELLLDVVRVAGILVIERALQPEDLESADQVFITSTTRDLLAVDSIHGLQVRKQGNVVDRLVEALQEYRREYIQRHAAPLMGQAR